MKNKKYAFTLVELIVVITILSILGTIAFLSLQGYSRDARNSKRTAELEMIEKSMELFYTNKGFYPDPNNLLNITYSGSIAWTQGTFGANQNQQLGSISDLPADPLTLTEYAYSTTSLKNEYQLGAVYEGLITQTKNQEILNKTYAGNQDGIAKVVGNYNGSILPVYSGSTTFILAVPTIINGDMSLLDVQSIIGNGKLVYNGGNTLPGNYSGTIFDTTKTNTYFTKTGTMLVYNGTIDQLKTNQTARLLMLKNLQGAYTGTTVGQTNGNIGQIINTTIDTSSPTQQAKDLGVSTLIMNLKIRQNQINNTKPSECITGMTEITLTNGQTWSCMNLGATTVWDGITEPTNCNGNTNNCNLALTWLGNYYQRGRNEPITGNFISSTYNGPLINGNIGNNDMYRGDGAYLDWWQNEAGSLTPNRWNGLNPQGPCSSGRHVPSTNDWLLLCNEALGTTCYYGMPYNPLISSKLKLPFSGYRNFGGTYDGQTSVGFYWSSTVNGDHSDNLGFGSSNIYYNGYHSRAIGLTIRCLKN